MEKNNVRKMLKLVGLFAVVALIAGVMVTPASAALTPQEYCEGKGGTWTGSTPDELFGECLDAINTGSIIGCPIGWYYDAWWGGSIWGVFLSTCTEFPRGISSGFVNYGMERKGLCKLVSIEDGALGGYVTAVVRGKPNKLKLKADGKTYVLPLVPGSEVANGDGTFTAQFYTLDPVTGQALVPAGDYSVRCHGGSGSNDGSGNTVTISY